MSITLSGLTKKKYSSVLIAMYLSIPLGTPQPFADSLLGGRLTVFGSHQIVLSTGPLRYLRLAALTSTLPNSLSSTSQSPEE